MGDATGQATAPAVLMTARQEQKLLAPWVLAGLAGLRRDFGRDLEFGIAARGVAAVAWRRDGTGEPLAAEDPVGLRGLVSASEGAGR